LVLAKGERNSNTTVEACDRESKRETLSTKEEQDTVLQRNRVRLLGIGGTEKSTGEWDMEQIKS